MTNNDTHHARAAVQVSDGAISAIGLFGNHTGATQSKTEFFSQRPQCTDPTVIKLVCEARLLYAALGRPAPLDTLAQMHAAIGIGRFLTGDNDTILLRSDLYDSALYSLAERLVGWRLRTERGIAMPPCTPPFPVDAVSTGAGVTIQTVCDYLLTVGWYAPESAPTGEYKWLNPTVEDRSLARCMIPRWRMRDIARFYALSYSGAIQSGKSPQAISLTTQGDLGTSGVARGWSVFPANEYDITCDEGEARDATE